MSEIRPRDVYRGRRRFGWLITLILMLLVILILGAVILFYSMQKYIVTGADGIRLEIPFLMEEGDERPRETQAPDIAVSDELIIDAPDFSQIETIAGEGVDELQALYFGASEITDGAAPIILARLEY